MQTSKIHISLTRPSGRSFAKLSAEQYLRIPGLQLGELEALDGFHPEAAQGLKSTAFTTRKDLQDWFAKKTGVPEKNISIAVTGGVPGYSMICDYQTGAHVTKKITSATLTKAGK